MYGPLRLELKKQCQSYQIAQYNIVMDVLGGYSEEVRELVRTKSRQREKLNTTEKVAGSHMHANKYSKKCKKYEDTKSSRMNNKHGTDKQLHFAYFF